MISFLTHLEPALPATLQDDSSTLGNRSPLLLPVVGAVLPDLITDEQRERLIRRAGRMMRLSMARYERSSCFGDRGMADYWRLTMEADIKARSAAQVARLEAQRGLA